MKLIYCKRCGDIIRLWQAPRKCMCGESKGQYINIIDAEISGPCLALGFSNEDFTSAVYHPRREEDRGGIEFLAFIIPEGAISVERVDDK